MKNKKNLEIQNLIARVLIDYKEVTIEILYKKVYNLFRLKYKKEVGITLDNICDNLYKMSNIKIRDEKTGEKKKIGSFTKNGLIFKDADEIIKYYSLQK